jgi:hypothetical protein
VWFSYRLSFFFVRPFTALSMSLDTPQVGESLAESAPRKEERSEPGTLGGEAEPKETE